MIWQKSGSFEKKKSIWILEDFPSVEFTTCRNGPKKSNFSFSFSFLEYTWWFIFSSDWYTRKLYLPSSCISIDFRQIISSMFYATPFFLKHVFFPKTHKKSYFCRPPPGPPPCPLACGFRTLIFFKKMYIFRAIHLQGWVLPLCRNDIKCIVCSKATILFLQL